MTQDLIYIFLPEEAQALLADNQIDLVRALDEQGVKCTTTYLSDPAAAGQDKSRSLTLAILAAGISVSMISTGIARILDAIGRNKKFRGKQLRCGPAIDGQGDVIRDKDGQVVMAWEDNDRLIEASQGTRESVRHKGEFLGLKFEVSSEGR